MTFRLISIQKTIPIFRYGLCATHNYQFSNIFLYLLYFYMVCLKKMCIDYL